MLGILALSVLSHSATVALVLAAMFLLGIAEVFADSASATLTPMLVPRADLALANGRIYAGFATVNQMVGPPVGAALFALAMPAPFAAQAGLVAVGAVLILRVRLPRTAPTEAGAGAARAADAAGNVERRRVRHDVAEGFRWTVHHPAVRTLTLTIFIFNIPFGAAWSILVLYAKDRLGMGSVGFGLLTTSAAIGGLVGTTSYGWITRRVSLGDLMKVGPVIETLTHLAFALTTSPVLALGIFFVFGAHAFIWGTTSVTVRQRAVPQSLQGRVGAVNGLGVSGGLVVGAALGGLIAGRWGITAPFWFGFVGSAVFVVAIWSQLRYIAHDDEPPPDMPPPDTPPAELWPAPVIEG